MNPQKLDFTKPITTRDGRKVRILCTDAPNKAYPVVGIIEGEWVINEWSVDGRFCATCHIEDGFDLINSPIKRKIEFWVNVYENSNGTAVPGCYLTKSDADKCAADGRIACLHFTREYEEGEGL